MLHTLQPIRHVFTIVGLAGLGFASAGHAQTQGASLGTGPWVFESVAQEYIKVSVLARGLDLPFGMVVLPGTATASSPLGDVLINERTGKVRLFRNGELLEQALIDLTATFGVQQLFDIELHPDFADNKLIYFTWIKQAPNPNDAGKLWSTTAAARARWDGNQLVGLEEIFEARPWNAQICGNSSRMHFLADKTFLLGVSHRCEEDPQKLDSHIGKVLRLNDDGSVPTDNPFVAVEGALPEIYTWGNRSVMDFVTHPATGDVWELENGPQGGDEVNILRQPGANYGWPLLSFGREYDGTRLRGWPWVEGTVLPEIFWVPSITVSSMTFYTGDKFPGWKNNLFVTSMLVGRTPNTGHLQRVTVEEQGQDRAREMLFTGLKQRIRYVEQGPDELLYLLTDSADGALLRVEPSSLDEARLFNSSQNTQGPVQAEAEAIAFPNADCQACHRTESALLGPSYREIADRYDLTDDNVNLLAARVIQGGGGAWGDSPMTPHPTLEVAEAREMVRQILSL